MAKIKLDIEREIGEIDSKIFGSFIEHLGRCIYGGIYDEDSPRSQEDGFRQDVLNAISDLGITQIRWPGGNFVSGYHWQDGVGPVENRPHKRELAWNSVETNRFGTDEFIDFCKKANVEPFICTNMGNGSMDEAQGWVEYCNGGQDTYYANLRRKYSEENPYKVKFWGLGNEVYGEWQIGHMEAEKYAKKAKEFGKVMKRTDSSIELVAVGGDDPAWNRKVVEELQGEVEYISTHMYLGNEEDDYYRYMASSKLIESKLKTLEGVIDSVMNEVPKPERMKIAFDEWNVWYRTTAEEDQLEEVYNLEDALVVSMFLNSFIRHCDRVKIANQAQLVNVIGMMITGKDRLVKQTVYYPFKAFANHNKGVGLDIYLDCENYSEEELGDVPYLDVSASYNKKGNTLTLNVVNRKKEDSIDVKIENQKGKLKGIKKVLEVNGEDIKSRNTSQEKNQVDITEVEMKADSNEFNYEFPPRSLTLIKMEISD